MSEQKLTLTIESVEGRVTVKLNDSPLPLENYEDIQWLLKSAYRHQRERQLMEKLSTIQETSDWVFPVKRKDVFRSGGCVYFLQCEAMPGLVKIGQTRNLSNRTKGLGNEYKSEMQILAFVKSPEHKDIEKALHVYFSDFRQGDTEWFKASPVIEFIQRFKS